MKPKKTEHWSATVAAHGACDSAVTWCRRQPSLAVAWQRCTNRDWMWWYLDKTIGHFFDHVCWCNGMDADEIRRLVPVPPPLELLPYQDEELIEVTEPKWLEAIEEELRATQG